MIIMTDEMRDCSCLINCCKYVNWHKLIVTVQSSRTVCRVQELSAEFKNCLKWNVEEV